MDDRKVLLSVGTPRSLVLTDNVQCVTVYFFTSLYTVIYIELCFSHRKWNIFYKRVKNEKKINISYLHNEPGLSLYEAIECQQFVTSTFAGTVFYIFFFWYEVSETVQLRFLSKDDKLSNEPRFLKKKKSNLCDKIRVLFCDRCQN